MCAHSHLLPTAAESTEFFKAYFVVYSICTF